ncbi:hypothetical protein HGA34_05150 [Candidatus Falkowbacteria bacterium]|nr:hypothetical protein [Candidatus Falkowbacteria bacterium]
MQSFEHYQKQFSRATETAFVDEQVKNRKMTEHLSTIFGAEESKFDRTVAMLSIMRTLVPVNLKYDYKTEHLPINPERYEFKEGTIGRGGENDVYLLESKVDGAPSMVLKMNHMDGGNVDQLVARAVEIKKEYEQVKERFKELPDLVPEEFSLIMESPRNGKPAIATIQQYYGTEIRDIFKLMMRENLPKLLEKNPRLKAEMVNFIRITEAMAAETGNMVDLLGNRNLSIVKAGDEERLLLLDPHLISHPERNQEEVKARQRKRLDYLRGEIGYDTAVLGAA